jgi:hypothetical protein
MSTLLVLIPKCKVGYLRESAASIREDPDQRGVTKTLEIALPFTRADQFA